MEDEELLSQLRSAKEELFNLRFQAATGQLENHGRLRAVRRDIARIYTTMRERELGIVTVDTSTTGTDLVVVIEIPEQDRERNRHFYDGALRGFRKSREGLVVSDKMDKTVVVAVEDRVKHRCTARSSGGPASSRLTTRQRLWHRRPCTPRRDAAAVSDQALARRGDPRAGEVGTRELT